MNSKKACQRNGCHVHRTHLDTHKEGHLSHIVHSSHDNMDRKNFQTSSESDGAVMIYSESTFAGLIGHTSTGHALYWGEKGGRGR